MDFYSGSMLQRLVSITVWCATNLYRSHVSVASSALGRVWRRAHLLCGRCTWGQISWVAWIHVMLWYRKQSGPRKSLVVLLYFQSWFYQLRLLRLLCFKRWKLTQVWLVVWCCVFFLISLKYVYNFFIMSIQIHQATKQMFSEAILSLHCCWIPSA